MASAPAATLPLRDALARARDFHASGNLIEAERWCRAILAAKPDHFETLHLLAIVKVQAGHVDEGLVLIGRAIAIDPRSAKAHNNQAAILRSLGRTAEALASCEVAITLDGSFTEAHRNRAAILKDMRRLDEALASCERALALNPASAEVHNIRGAICQDLERYQDAIAAYDRALALTQSFPEALSNRGGSYVAIRQYTKALADCDAALALRPMLVDAHYHRGLALSGLGRHADAERSFRQALAGKPDFAKALLSHAGELAYLRKSEEAVGELERALALDPGLDFAEGALLAARMHCCDWREFDARRANVVADVRSGRRTMDPFAFLAVSDRPADQRQCAETWVDTWFPAPPGLVRRHSPRQRGRIHIAYLSGDFREHAVAFLSAGLFEQHDRSRFEITAISLVGSDGSAIRARLERAFERFVDAERYSDQEIAGLVRDLDVDILVDLGGLTGSARTAILAERPAAVQVNFLGFTATMGTAYIDYIVADRTVIPEDERPAFAESVVYLPDSFQVNDSRRAQAGSAVSRNDAGLPDHGVVFCCFNSSFKILPATFAAWMRILRAVDGSVLWLLEGNAAAMANLRREAEAAGVAPERLVFAPAARPDEHIARHQLADLFLDTLPFNAHTTASDALWAGVPVLTCLGSTFAGRVAASLLHALGLDELITRAPEEYEALAIRLASRPAELAALRARLGELRVTSPLFDTDRFRHHLEAAYAAMWERHLRGERPQSFAVPAMNGDQRNPTS
ncbi:MAG: tetratricopeptide repeat protein [Burkholderiales bacterium]